MIYFRALFLAPGIILHEFAHHLFCVLTGVKVRKVVYFRMANPAGFVAHEEPELFRQLFAVVAGPLFLNSAAAIVGFNLALRQAVLSEDPAGMAGAAVFAWLALSFSLQAFPSRLDASNLLHGSSRHLIRWNPFALAGYPVALLIYLVQLARPLGSEWLYALLMASVALRGFLYSQGE